MTEKVIRQVTCKRCGHKWFPRKLGRPTWCPNCISPLWDKPMSRRMITVYAYVAGDLPHVGHLRALQQAKALGDYLIVGVLADDAIADYKRRPVMPFEERIEMFANMKPVDEVVPQYNVDPTNNLRDIPDIDIVVHGDDWNEDFPGAAYMRSVGKMAIRTEYYKGQSTTRIIEEIIRRHQEGSLP